MSDRPTCLYEIDAVDILRKVNPFWSDFAVHNEAHHLLPQAVIGQSLWDFVTVTRVRHLYRLILEHVRAKNVHVSFPFRCDSPAVKRDMRMVVRPRVQGGALFESTIQRETNRPPVALLDPHAARSGTLVRVCSWCKRVHDPANGWVEVAEAMARMRIFGDPCVPSVTHAICQPCFDTTIELLDP